MSKSKIVIKKNIKLINNKTIRTTRKIKNHTKIHFRGRVKKRSGIRRLNPVKRMSSAKGTNLADKPKTSAAKGGRKITTGRLLIIDVVIILVIFGMFGIIRYIKNSNYEYVVDYDKLSIAGKWYKVDLDEITVVSFTEGGKYEEKDLSGNKMDSGSYTIENHKLKLGNKAIYMNYFDEKEQFKDVIDKDNVSEYELRKYFYTEDKDNDRIDYFSREDSAADQLEANLSTNRYYEKSGMVDDNGFAIDGEGNLLAYVGNVAEITIPKEVNTIAENAMSADYKRGLNTKKVTIPSNVKKIESGAFSFSKIDTVVIEEGVNEIETWAFGDSEIKDIYFPETVENMQKGIFDTEEGLEGLTIHCKKDSQVEQFFKDNPPTGKYTIEEY